jgi:hypothetical protein
MNKIKFSLALKKNATSRLFVMIVCCIILLFAIVILQNSYVAEFHGLDDRWVRSFHPETMQMYDLAFKYTFYLTAILFIMWIVRVLISLVKYLTSAHRVIRKEMS